MAPPLAAAVTQAPVDVAVYGAAPVARKPVHEWTHEDVCAWVATVEGGRFARVALPAGIAGAGLLMLNARKLGELFAGDLRSARGEGETDAWVVSSEVSDGLGRALHKCLRRLRRHRCITAELQGRTMTS